MSTQLLIYRASKDTSGVNHAKKIFICATKPSAGLEKRPERAGEAKRAETRIESSRLRFLKCHCDAQREAKNGKVVGPAFSLLAKRIVLKSEPFFGK